MLMFSTSPCSNRPAESAWVKPPDEVVSRMAQTEPPSAGVDIEIDVDMTGEEDDLDSKW